MLNLLGSPSVIVRPTGYYTVELEFFLLEMSEFAISICNGFFFMLFTFKFIMRLLFFACVFFAAMVRWHYASGLQFSQIEWLGQYVSAEGAHQTLPAS